MTTGPNGASGYVTALSRIVLPPKVFLSPEVDLRYTSVPPSCLDLHKVEPASIVTTNRKEEAVVNGRKP